MFKNIWHLWALSLGEKAHKEDKLADKVAIIRTFLFATYFITNCFIIYGVLKTHHFSKKPSIIEIKIYENQNYAEELHSEKWYNLGVGRDIRAEGVYRTAKIKAREFE